VDISEVEYEAVAYTAEYDQYSNHLIAQAIVRRAIQRGIDLSKIKVTNIIEVSSKGIVSCQ
jgi:cation transport ATPase